MGRTVVFFAVIWISAVVAAGEKAGHPFLVSSYTSGAVYRIEADGAVTVLAGDARLAQDVWPLPDGKVLYSFADGARIIDPAHENKVVWEFVDKVSKPQETHSCQPLPDGSVLLCQCGPARLIEVNAKGEIAKEIKLQTSVTRVHVQFRMARRTKEGTYLVCHLQEGKAEELDASGTLLKTFTAKDRGFNTVHGCVRLANGNTLLTTGYGGGTFEFDKDGKIVWSFTSQDVPHERRQGRKYCTYAAGVQRLPDGNTVITYYGGDPMLVEVTPDRKIVWEYSNAELGRIAGQARLNREGKPLPFELER